MRCLTCFFLLSLVMSSPTYAATIVDVEEMLRVVAREDVSNCEWIEITEVKTTTTYRESSSTNQSEYIPGVSYQIGFLIPSQYNDLNGVGSGFRERHICFPEAREDEQEIPDRCKDSFTIIGLGYTLTISTQSFREWSETTISHVLRHYNTCHTCEHNPVPEPASIALLTTGSLLLFFVVKKRWARP